jgi:hypothetical protein
MSDLTKQKTNYWEFLLKREWSYTAGAVLLAVLAAVLVVVTGVAWGVTGPFSNWGGLALKAIGIDADSWVIFNGSLAKYSLWKDQTGMLDLGIVLGALVSCLLAASFKFKKIKGWRQVAAACSGGLLMGIGARLSLGCNIGAFFSGLPAFSLHGWVFGIFIFIGAAVGSRLLKKWFM